MAEALFQYGISKWTNEALAKMAIMQESLNEKVPKSSKNKSILWLRYSQKQLMICVLVVELEGLENPSLLLQITP